MKTKNGKKKKQQATIMVSTLALNLTVLLSQLAVSAHLGCLHAQLTTIIDQDRGEPWTPRFLQILLRDCRR